MRQQPERAHRFDVVGQRFAHAHEHHIGDRAARAGESQHLLYHLTGVQIAREAELARHAEHARHRTAGLCGDADRLPRAGRAGWQRVHLDCLDLLAIVETQQHLRG